MKVEIEHLSGGKIQVLRGEPEQVRQQILILFPWVTRQAHPKHDHDPLDIKDVLDRLSNAQDLWVEVEA